MPYDQRSVFGRYALHIDQNTDKDPKDLELRVHQTSGEGLSKVVSIIYFGGNFATFTIIPQFKLSLLLVSLRSALSIRGDRDRTHARSRVYVHLLDKNEDRKSNHVTMLESTFERT